MKIIEVKPINAVTLWVVAEDGRSGSFDIRPYLNSKAFSPLTNWTEFSQVRNGGYYIEWRCGADLSSDTIEARWTIHTITASHQSACASGLPLAQP